MQKVYKNILDEIITNISTLGSYSFFLIITLLFLATNQMNNALFMLTGIILINLIIIPIRLLYKKDRPKKQKANSLLEQIRAHSMPSMHAALVSFLLQSMLFYFEGGFAITALLTSLTIAVLYSRIYLHKHDTKDLVVGFIVGLIAFFAITFIQLWFL